MELKLYVKQEDKQREVRLFGRQTSLGKIITTPDHAGIRN